MSKRLDILGARIFGASVCHARKYLQLFRKCPNVWTKSYNLAIMHKHKPYIPSTYACICAFCYFIDFLHTFLDIFNFFSRSNSVWNMSALLTRIARQVSRTFDLNRRNLVQYSPLKHFFKIRGQIVLTFRIFRVYYYT